MGNWTCKSCDNDACMDEIPASFLDKNPTQKQIGLTLRKIYNPSKRFYCVYEQKEIKLGSVIYFLEKPSHSVIENKYLKEAIACARSLKRDIIYLKGWKCPKDRRIQLEKEIGMLVRAQKRR
jgi:hypothetical protein